MSERVIYDVEPRSDGWAAQRRGTSRAATVTSTKTDAVAEARRLAKQHARAQVVVRGADGRIQEEFTYGDDPTRSPG
jgi:hypothetical protein